MPRIVDHSERRDQIAAAMRRVILRDGIASASVRAVAAEAGWSAGAVRHYFPDQAALLRFAVFRTMAEAPGRVRALIAAGPGFANAQTLVEQMLPLDDLRRVEMHVWLAMVDTARHDEGFDQQRADAFDGMRYVCRTAVAWLEGVPAPSAYDVALPPASESRAEVLHALVDGLALHGIHYPERVSADQMRKILTAHLASITPRSVR